MARLRVELRGLTREFSPVKNCRLRGLVDVDAVGDGAVEGRDVLRRRVGRAFVDTTVLVISDAEERGRSS